MPKAILCLLLLMSGWRTAQSAPPMPASAGRMLILENSTMPLTTAKATLFIGPLTRTNGIYAGDFKIKLFPYFFKSDRGRLAINVPDKELAALNQGRPVALTGTSTSAKNGVVRHIEISVLPQDRDHGTVSLWFMAGKQKMIFNPAYQFTNPVLTTAFALRPPPMNSLRQGQP